MTAFRDLGWFQLPDGRRKLLTWWSDGAVTLDGPGGVEILGFITTEETALRVFDGWSDEPDRPIAWVRARMAAAAAEGLLACSDCGGTGRTTFHDPFQRGGLIEAVCPTCVAVNR